VATLALLACDRCAVSRLGADQRRSGEAQQWAWPPSSPSELDAMEAAPGRSPYAEDQPGDCHEQRGPVLHASEGGHEKEQGADEQHGPDAETVRRAYAQ
jgi:hypothetical protein